MFYGDLFSMIMASLSAFGTDGLNLLPGLWLSAYPYMSTAVLVGSSFCIVDA